MWSCNSVLVFVWKSEMITFPTKYGSNFGSVVFGCECYDFRRRLKNFFQSQLSGSKMKLKNREILDKLYNGNPKISPLTLPYLSYVTKVEEIITNDFKEQKGAAPIKGSFLEKNIKTAAENYAIKARQKFKKKSGNYKRASTAHFFKCTTKIRLRSEATKSPPKNSQKSI